jgi:hypothetical protein
MTASTDRHQSALLRALRLTAGALLAIAAAGANAEPIAFGSRTLQVPDPEGFQPVAKSMPAYIQAAQAYLPPTNRLAEVYVQPTAAAAMAGGRPIALDRYFQLQVFRKLDGVAISPDDFDGAKKEIEDGIDEAMKNSRQTISQLADKGNTEVARTTGTDPKVSISGFDYLGVYRREPWGLFFTFKAHVAGADSQQGEDLIGAATLVLVNYQAVYLYSYAHYTGDADRHWAEQAVSRWADALRAANPDDPAMASKVVPFGNGFDWNTLLQRAFIGAVIGGLIGLVSTFIARKRKR